MTRFDKLSARNLLFYQTEIAELEDEFKELDRADSNAKDQISTECQSDWGEFVRNVVDREGADATSNTREREKMELVMKIRDKLEN